MTGPLDPLDLFDAAMAWLRAGYSVVPVADDGSKRPAVAWKEFQTEAADEKLLRRWFDPDAAANPKSNHGLGVVTGAVSGQLEMIEFEGRAVLEGLPAAMAAAMAEHGQGELWTLLTHGYTELTPTNGLHLYFRVSDGPARGNTKLARRPATDTELAAAPKDKVKVLIETRGEGGFVVVSPTPGTHHALGRGWTVLTGSPAGIPTITVEQRDTLYAVATLFDAMPTPVAAPPAPDVPGTNSSPKTGGQRPGDDYNAKASWDDILLGWTRVRRLGPGWAWRRPGKDDRSISATTGQAKDADRLYVFSTSTEFESERPYDMFGAYCLLQHGGDFAAAGSDLKRRGYGGQDIRLPRPTSSTTSSPTSSPTPAPAPIVSTGGGLSLFDGPMGPPPPAEAPPPPPPPPPGPVIDPQPFGIDPQPFAGGVPQPVTYTESAIAEALALMVTGRWNWCPELGWQQWSGTHWQARSSEDVVETARLYLKELWLDAMTALTAAVSASAGEQEVKALQGVVGACRALQSKAKGEAVAKYTQGQAGIRVEAETFDSDPELLNCGNGVVNLRTGELLPHDPALLMRKFTRVNYLPGAVHPDWQRALGAVVDDETRYWLRILFGAAATGYTFDEDLVPFFFGEGENGKSTVMGGVRFCLGSYAQLILPKLLGGKGSDHETYLMALLGARLAYLEELPRGHVLDIARIKQISGTAEITGRYLYRNQLTFKTTHLLAVNTNYAPVVTDVDHGTWRRLLSVPWPFTFDKGSGIRDKGLRERVHTGREQQEAVLAWVVSGAHEWLAAGRVSPPIPKACVEHTNEWRNDNDTIGNFLSKNTVEATSYEGPLLVSELMEKFNANQPSGAVPWQMRTFVSRLRKHPFLLDRGLEVIKSTDRAVHRAQLVIYGLKIGFPSGGTSIKPETWDRLGDPN